MSDIESELTHFPTESAVSLQAPVVRRTRQVNDRNLQFGRWIRSERRTLGLTQREVAKTVGSSQGWLSLIEAGKIWNLHTDQNSSWLAKIAGLFNVDINEVLDRFQLKKPELILPQTEQVAFCPSAECPELRLVASHNPNVTRPMLAPLFCEASFDELGNCMQKCPACGTVLTYRCADCQTLILYDGQRNCSRCGTFLFADLACRIVSDHYGVDSTHEIAKGPGDKLEKLAGGVLQERAKRSIRNA